jgi:two-component system CheB/CheR fusion protein
MTRVLLVEPDPAAQSLIQSLLTTHVAGSGDITIAPALDQVGARASCDVIVAARVTAGADFDELRRVRRDLPLVPVVLIEHAPESVETAALAIDAGADEVLFEEDLAGPRLIRAVSAAIARRVVSMRAQREGDERFRLLIDGTELGSFELHPQTKQLIWSDRTRLLFGAAPADALSYETFLRAVHPNDRARVNAAVQGAMRGDKLGRYVDEFRTVGLRDGQERWLAAWGRVVIGEADQPVRLVGVVLDISERKRAEHGLVEADRRKTEFLATLAHELRNPLAPIRFAVKMLERYLVQVPPAARPLSVIDRQVSHLARLIDDLLDVSRITRNKIQLRTEVANLATILQAAIESVEPLLEGAGHQLETDIQSAPIPVEVDTARLVQVFSNLLNNAVKFTPSGGTIRVAARGSGTEAEVHVVDDGMGIAPELLPHVFDLFRQEDTTLERSASGLGIGLTLAKTLVAMHDGTIEARSGGPGAGAEFIVRLPISAKTPHAGTNEVVAPAAADPLRVLIVDDNRDAAEMLEMFARARGHEVTVAYEGYTAVGTALSFRPDLVLLDIGMPGLNGYNVARMLRQQKADKQLFVVAVTGWGQEDDRRRGRDAGFDLHLTKPVDPAALDRLFERIAHTRDCAGCDQCLRPGSENPAQESPA